jgi:2-iminobutanoate/2-iminopropanoate deaminase
MDGWRGRRDNGCMPNENSTATREFFSATNPSPNAPIYTPAVAFGNLVFLAGKTSWNAPDPTDIKSCVKHVLDEIEKELVNAGSSMEQVLKVTVYLRNIDDWAELNEVYVGRFGANPPARTTVAAILPKESRVEIDVIAHR